MICGFGDEVYGGFGDRMQNNAFRGAPQLSSKKVPH